MKQKTFRNWKWMAAILGASALAIPTITAFAQDEARDENQDPPNQINESRPPREPRADREGPRPYRSQWREEQGGRPPERPGFRSEAPDRGPRGEEFGPNQDRPRGNPMRDRMQSRRRNSEEERFQGPPPMRGEGRPGAFRGEGGPGRGFDAPRQGPGQRPQRLGRGFESPQGGGECQCNCNCNTQPRGPRPGGNFGPGGEGERMNPSGRFQGFKQNGPGRGPGNAPSRGSYQRPDRLNGQSPEMMPPSGRGGRFGKEFGPGVDQPPFRRGPAMEGRGGEFRGGRGPRPDFDGPEQRNEDRERQ